MIKSTKIHVAGAGIAGLCAAIGLTMAGARVTVFEAKTAENHDTGASYILREHACRVLDAIGVSEHFHHHAKEMSNLIFDGGEGTPIDFGFDFSDMPESENAPLIVIDRATLVGILREKAQDLGVQIEYGKKLQSITENADSVVVTFADGSKATSELLVGADGRRSRTRDLLFPEISLRYAGGWNIYGRADAAALPDAIRAQFTEGYSFIRDLGEGRIIVAYADDDADPNKLTWLISGTAPRKIPSANFETAPPQEFLGALRDSIAPISATFTSIIDAATAVAPTQVFHLPPLPTWSRGRTVLIGDAVNAADPVTGMGTSLSLEDGLYLAKLLRDHPYWDAFYYLYADRHEASEAIIATIDPSREGIADSNAVLESYSFDVNWSVTDRRPVSDLFTSWPSGTSSTNTEP